MIKLMGIAKLSNKGREMNNRIFLDQSFNLLNLKRSFCQNQISFFFLKKYLIIFDNFFINEYNFIRKLIKNYLYKSTLLNIHSLNLSIYLLFCESYYCINKEGPSHHWYYKNNFF